MAQTKIDKIPSKHVEKYLTESWGNYPSFEGICKNFANLCNYRLPDFLTPVITFNDNLSYDIQIAFPGRKGYSVRNLKYMAKFSATYSDREFVQQVVAQIPWGHNIVLLDKISDIDERKWYIKKSVENGWSRNVLIHQIEIDTLHV